MGTNVKLGTYTPPAIQNQDFNISLKMDNEENSFVPLGIEDFNGKEENSFFIFDYTLTGSDIDALYFQVADSNGNVLFAMGHLAPVVISASKKPILQAMKPKKPQPPEKTLQDILTEMTNYTKQGSYSILWDGFDNDGIYDSAKLNGKTLKAKIKGVKAGVEQTVEAEFTLSYKEVDWVDVKINKNTKQIETTLRVNLQDGGAKGLECKDIKSADERSSTKTVCPWDKIPLETIKTYGREPIKSRLRSFKDLERLALEGLSQFWSRNKNRSIAKFVTINNSQYDVTVFPQNTTTNSMDAVALIYNTNGEWLRSMHPGKVIDITSLGANTILSDRVVYNDGYLNNTPWYKLFKADNWYYIDNTKSYKDGTLNIDKDFSYTSAHECGHEIIKFYASREYSYHHEGSSDNSSPLPVSDGGFEYPVSGEIDLMKYYNHDVGWKDFERVAANEQDVLGLNWLTKLKIK